MTDECLAEIRARHLAKSFHDQNWADMDTLLADNDRLRKELDEVRSESSYLATILCDARGGHDWRDYDEPDKSVEGRWQRCTKCRASRLSQIKAND